MSSTWTPFLCGCLVFTIWWCVAPSQCFPLDTVTHVCSLWRRGHEARLLIFSLPPWESGNVHVLTEGRLKVYQPLFIPPSYLCPGASVSTRLFLHLSPTITACIHLFIYSHILAPLPLFCFHLGPLTQSYFSSHTLDPISHAHPQCNPMPLYLSLLPNHFFPSFLRGPLAFRAFSLPALWFRYIRLIFERERETGTRCVLELCIFFPLIWRNRFVSFSFNQSPFIKENLGHLCFQTHLHTHTHTQTYAHVRWQIDWWQGSFSMMLSSL